MQALGLMGDARHKKSPPGDPQLEVTPDLIAAVWKAFDENAQYNDALGYKKGDQRYKIATHADLSGATGIDPTQLGRMIGPARGATKWARPIKRSAFVPRIRQALGLPLVRQITVPETRADIVEVISRLDETEFQEVLADMRARKERR